MRAGLRLKILQRDGFACQGLAMPGPCGGELTIHHLLPRGWGGGNERHNLLTVCRNHHDAIHARAHRDLAYEIGLLIRPHSSRRERKAASRAHHYDLMASMPYPPQGAPEWVIRFRTRSVGG